MAGLEELKKKLVPLFDAEKGFSPASTSDPFDSYSVSSFLKINRTTNYIFRSADIGFCEALRWWHCEFVESIIRCIQHQ